ncbi:MAG: HAD-IA family hydrolase [Brasilonema octagenarum HA4186-MV1]|jgi:beta-phosphoglucomutase|uniref:HAD family phosphatase n=1 Tax=Brasilonema sennae CENA114 TaxID=415709 RepID=A0A856MHI5_9CYAN|nr:HAD-IA family hydrolase [Brasilonema sennae]MBW4624487.1 HAD-IA family hydrolase [Brasilonema octagenarum HA4186-MV1]QDL09714.1 HAD family phosphatase [Brasilonema sennae CENA114]QDL16068.1 HAD family phosphatase [Brasilonema octagenarum UFV-E1]
MLAAILFDLDGTIANTDPIHYQVWREMLIAYDMDIDETFYKFHISGRTNPQILEDFLPQLSPEEGAKFADEKEALFREKAKTILKPLSGFLELIAWTDTHQLKRALVTNAPRLNVQFVLEVLEIKEVFHTVVIAENEIAAKPNPAPYQVALNNLGITAEQAIALEDSPSGIRSAVGAGIRTIGVTTTQESIVLQSFGAFMTVPDFTDLQLWTLLNSSVQEDVACLDS